MNERIQVLYKQAMVTVPENPGNAEFTWFDPEKFAELIVRECVGLVNEQLQHNNPNDSLLALKIKEHFGVEE